MVVCDSFLSKHGEELKRFLAEAYTANYQEEASFSLPSFKFEKYEWKYINARSEHDSLKGAIMVFFRDTPCYFVCYGFTIAPAVESPYGVIKRLTFARKLFREQKVEVSTDLEGTHSYYGTWDGGLSGFRLRDGIISALRDDNPEITSASYSGRPLWPSVIRVELRDFSFHDGDAECEVLREMPDEEGGFINPAYGHDLAAVDWAEKIILANRSSHHNTKVPCCLFWIMVDTQIVGVLKYRNDLDRTLARRGGNISLWIRPSCRNLGIGTAAVQEVYYRTLTRFAVQNDRYLLTIGEDNAAARTIAERFSDGPSRVEHGIAYYWIQL